MFTVEERERIRERLVGMGRADPRIEAAAAVGASALDGGDRWSDLDLAFGLAEGVPILLRESEGVHERAARLEADLRDLVSYPAASSWLAMWSWSSESSMSPTLTAGATVQPGRDDIPA